MWGGGTSSEAKSSPSPRSSAGQAAALYLLLLLHHQPPEISRKARKGGWRGQKRQEVPRCADVGGRPHFLRPGRGASCSPDRDEPNVFLPTGLSVEIKPLRFQKGTPVLHGRPSPCSAPCSPGASGEERVPWAEAPARGLFAGTWPLQVLLTLQTNKPKIFGVLWLKGKTSGQWPGSNSMFISQACPEPLGRGHHPSLGRHRGDSAPAPPAGQRHGLGLSKTGGGAGMSPRP